jgi:hypothetical protein
MTFSLRRIFGGKSAAPAAEAPGKFDLKLTLKGRTVLHLQDETFAFLRDHGLLADGFLKTIGQNMPNGGRQSWELRDAHGFVSLSDFTFSLNRVDTISPMGATQTRRMLKLDRDAYGLALGNGVFSDKAKDFIERCTKEYRALDEFSLRRSTGSDPFAFDMERGKIGITFYETAFRRESRMENKRHFG